VAQTRVSNADTSLDTANTEYTSAESVDLKASVDAANAGRLQREAQ
jgi:hypothetical protein